MTASMLIKFEAFSFNWFSYVNIPFSLNLLLILNYLRFEAMNWNIAFNNDRNSENEQNKESQIILHYHLNYHQLV